MKLALLIFSLMWAGSFRTDYIAAPSLPSMGSAGTIITDPTFGSRIVRVTDANSLVGTDSSYLNRSYSTGSSAENLIWSKNSDRFLVAHDGGWVLPFTWVASTMTATRVEAGTGLYNGRVITNMGGEPTMSWADNDKIYGVSGMEVRQMTWGTWTASVLKDLTGLPPDGTALGGVSAGGGDRLCVWGNQDSAHWVAWFDAASPGTVHILDTSADEIDGVPISVSFGGAGVHNARMSRDGRYISITIVAGGMHIWDTQTNTVSTALIYGAGHKVGGMGYFLNTDDMPGAVQFQIIARKLTDLFAPYPILPRHGAPYTLNQDMHPSWNNAVSHDMRPVCLAAYSATNNDNGEVYGGEIICAYTDGSGQIERFGRHRTYYTAFEDSPRGNVSPDGRFYAFTSNWDRTLGTSPFATPRYDMFIIETLMTRLRPSYSACSGCQYADLSAAITALQPSAADYGPYDIVLTSDPAAATWDKFSQKGTHADNWSYGSGHVVATWRASGSCKVDLYTDSARTTRPSDASSQQDCTRASSVVSGGLMRYVFGGSASLTANTRYWYTITDGSRQAIGAFSTRPAGSGSKTYTYTYSTARTGNVCTDAAMSISCSAISSASTHTVTVPQGAVRYYQAAGGAVIPLVAP